MLQAFWTLQTIWYSDIFLNTDDIPNFCIAKFFAGIQVRNDIVPTNTNN